jgi:hypothetical protein
MVSSVAAWSFGLGRRKGSRFYREERVQGNSETGTEPEFSRGGDQWQSRDPDLAGFLFGPELPLVLRAGEFPDLDCFWARPRAFVFFA